MLNLSPAAGPSAAIGRLAMRALAWAGMAAAAAGLVLHDMFNDWKLPAPVLAAGAASLAAGWLLQRLARCSLATGIGVVWLALLAGFTGLLPLLATVLMAAAAAALGDWLLRRGSLAAACLAGLALGGGVIGWLLPLPVHHAWSYLAACAALAIARRQALAGRLAPTRAAWSGAVAAAPRSAALAVLLLGLASTSCWLPTMQYDDTGYHLLLPWSLLLEGRHPLDPEYHVWALAPWWTDVVQAVPQVLAGREARGAVNALWLVLLAAGVWRLTRALGGGAKAAWWGVAVQASLPMTAALATGMQTELPTATLVVWLVTLGHRPPTRRNMLAMMALAGALLATKLAAVLMLLALLPWLVARQRTALDLRTGATGLALMLGIGASSYAFAAVIAGNPLLPLANGFFQSPYFPPHNFSDPVWQAGFGPSLPWQLTFATTRYFEASRGAAGVVLVALAGAWLVALALRRTRSLALLTLVLASAMLFSVQYLRYVHPVLVLALPALVLALRRAEPVLWVAMLAFVVAANLAFQPRGNWMLSANAVTHVLRARGAPEPVFATFAPERLLARRIRGTWQADRPGVVLALADRGPMLAEFGSRARTISWYDPTLRAGAISADRDPGGQAWARLLCNEGIRDVVLYPDSVRPAREAGLARAGATERGAVGDFRWWRLPPACPTPSESR